MVELIKNPHIDFLKLRKIAISVSGICILIGMISILLHGGLNLSIDFTGGTLIQVKFQQEISTGDVRAALSKIGYGNAIIQKTSEANEFLIRVPLGRGDNDLQDRVSEVFSNTLKDNNFEIRRVERVGPKIGSELRSKAVLTVISAILVILIYITIRFEFKFALGAIVALVHDVLFTLGVFSILNLEVSLSVIAAFLTIVGYSLNDTIVIFDRVRENLRLRRRDKLPTIINVSINESLSRTIITSFTTFVVVLVLLIAGGDVIRPFSAAMLTGVIVGTYSSVYIASPVVLSYEKRLKSGKKNKK